MTPADKALHAAPAGDSLLGISLVQDKSGASLSAPMQIILLLTLLTLLPTVFMAVTPFLRIVVVLRYTEGLTYDQIAEVLNCSPGTVASRLHRAHKALERRFAKMKQGGRHV